MYGGMDGWMEGYRPNGVEQTGVVIVYLSLHYRALSFWSLQLDRSMSMQVSAMACGTNELHRAMPM